MVFNPKLIDFFKRHNLYDKEMFDYFSEHSTMIDYQDDEQRLFIGCLCYINNKKKLINIHINIPYVYDDITMLISIHELVHAIMLYKYLNKKIKLDVEIEILPMLYEKIFIDEINSQQLIEYEEYLNKQIDTSKHKEYTLGLKIRDELLKSYDYNIDKLNKKVKKLVKKYK